MSTTTEVDGGAVESAAGDLEKLVTDDTIKKFEYLKRHPLEAGSTKFDAAEWLEQIVIDRRHGMMEHVKNLQFIFDGLAKTLRSISKGFDDTDTDSANALKDQALIEINNWIKNSRDHTITSVGSGAKDNYDSHDSGAPPKPDFYKDIITDTNNGNTNDGTNGPDMSTNNGDTFFDQKEVKDDDIEDDPNEEN